MEDEIDLVQRTLEKVTNKWTIRILCAYSEDQSPIRFNELKRQVGGITQKVLSQISAGWCGAGCWNAGFRPAASWRSNMP